MIGRLIDGRYQVRSLIAKGGMATVYVATDLRLERRVAIKVMHDHLAADERFRERFIREARSAAKITHPNVVNVYDQGDDEVFAYMVMEYIPGITLRDLLHDHHKLTPEQSIDVLDAVLAGLQAAHKLGIVHRDLKPENVLLADDGRIKLSDFGLARAASANTATGQVLLGTIAYLSPELVTKGTADVRSDIYSLGIMLFEMLTGEQPYRGDQPVNIAYRHANETVPAPSEVNPNVPHELDELVAWSTERDPELRPADAGVMLEALRRAEAELGQSVRPAPPTAVLATAADENIEDTDPTELALITSQLSSASSPPDFEGEHVEPFAPGAAPTTVNAPLFPEQDSSDVAPQLPPATTTAETGARKRRRFGAVIAVLLIAIVVAAGGVGWWFGLGPGSYDTVPAVVSLTQTDAESAITAAGFTVGEVTQEFSLEVAAGTVMDMDPQAGTSLAPESPISLVVSAGPEMLTVPPLEGLTLEEAESAITEAGFTYDPATTLRQFSDEEADVVLSATDTNGAPLPETLAEGQPIRLIASAGVLPEVAGETEANATQLIEDAGLVVNVSSREYSASVASGVVIAYSATTDPVVPGDTINISVSRGPAPVVLPDVVGKPIAEAISQLEGLGLTVGHNVPLGIVNDPNPVIKFVVSTQSPAAGVEVPAGSNVTLTATATL
ncbi:Stk1 family PASTA domain-containing Ser/Thr kinase [Pseudoclavibacter sp. AY1F1]|uniref:Stk1 family PASTA domain-containing Ser/Thr kinase n=1 Tax=Pseudoclavibacter sp. AY1F1 TaxID=2080583 RepID=UPI000CE8EB75|nr:Stk1 family PASTA domain-containing Ser/Thr kinase [Pseudoclavibacter sp. AY1F1]